MAPIVTNQEWKSKIQNGHHVRNLSIVLRPTESLKSSSTNPRTHSKKQIRKIMRSIESFGFNVPVLIDDQGNIIAGHGRVEAAKLLGISHLPTISLAHLSAAEIMAYTIADNRLADCGEWDERLLCQQLKELSELDLNFSIEATGFEIAEIDLRIEGSGPAEQCESDQAHEVTETIRTGFEVSKRGDLWSLGEHRLLCGDALEAGSYSLILQGAQAAMVFTDPPYNARIPGYVTGHGRIQHDDFRMASGEMSEQEFTSFLRKIGGLLTAHAVDGSLHFIFIDWRHLQALLSASEGVYSELKNLCVWAKDNAGLGSLYRSQHELILVLKHGKAAHRNNIQLGKFGRNRTNLWQYPAVNSFSRPTGERNLLALHPTVKPVALVADAILDCTARRDVVLDPFLGSGTTIIAAERTGRICCGLEIEPKFVDVTIRRWELFTGLAAVHAGSGRKFTEIEQELKDQA